MCVPDKNFDEFIEPKSDVNTSIAYPTTDMFINAIPGTRNYDDKPLGELYDDIQKRYIKPIIGYVWKYKAGYFSESRILKYKSGGEEGQSWLRQHHDDTTCASIISLNDDYEGGGTWFERQKTTVNPRAGWCTIHPSKLTHRHAGRRVTKGKRFILITFIN